jgi:hypothetical protein
MLIHRTRRRSASIATAGLLSAALATTAPHPGAAADAVHLGEDPRPDGDNGVFVDPIAGGYAPWAYHPGKGRSERPSDPPKVSRGDSVTQECGRDDDGALFAPPAGNVGGTPVACADGYLGVPSATARQLAQRAVRSLRLPLPDVRTTPPRRKPGVVGLPEWVWVPHDQWRPLTKRATAGPEWAKVTATPKRLLIEPGSGLPTVACTGPGTAYDLGVAASAQNTDCSYTFRRLLTGQSVSVFRFTVTVVWAGRWVGPGGTGGTLPDLRRSRRFPLRVIEVQALYERKGSPT